MAVEDHNRIGCEAFLLGIIYMHWLRIQENIQMDRLTAI